MTSTGSWTVPGSLIVNQNLSVLGTVTAVKATAWTTLPGATAYTTAQTSGTNQTPQYCIDELGYVRLRGIITPATTLFTLPAGARPPNNFYKPVTGLSSSTVTTGMLTVLPTGVASATSAGTTWISLDDTIFAVT